MGSKVATYDPVVQVAVPNERQGQSSTVQVHVRQRQRGSARWRLLAGWSVVALVPWGLQARSFIFLALPHRIPPELIVPYTSTHDSEPEFKSDLEAQCPVRGLHIAGVWWNVSPTNYASVSHWSSSSPSSENGAANESHLDVICNFVVAQYNIHGSYRLNHRTDGTTNSSKESFDPFRAELPSQCKEHYSPIVYHFYHGSIGYYSFFEHGEGTYCLNDRTAYVLVKSLGSADLNGRLLAQDNNGTKMSVGAKRWSKWYAALGMMWLSFRALVVHRSWKLCKRYGVHCDSLHESLSLRQALVFVHESARLAAHGASNFQRAGLLYALVESLMTDLFLLIAKDGAGARTQFASLGYNLACVLSLLFEMLEATKLLGRTSHRIIRRLFFNVETGLLGELLCALLLQHYLTTLNQSPQMRDSLERGEALSFYIWSLVGHGAIVLGLASFILGVRAVGALIVSKLVLGSIRAIAAPNCVEEAQRGRSKSAIIKGYVRHPNRSELYMTRDTLKAFGLLQMQLSPVAARRSSDNGDSVLDVNREAYVDNFVVLVHPRTEWVSTRQSIVWDAVGYVVSDHVVPTKSFPSVGSATFCNHALGGSLL